MTVRSTNSRNVLRSTVRSRSIRALSAVVLAATTLRVGAVSIVWGLWTVVTLLAAPCPSG